MKSESVHFYHILAVSSQIHCVGVQKQNDKKKSIFVEIFVDRIVFSNKHQCYIGTCKYEIFPFFFKTIKPWNCVQV